MLTSEICFVAKCPFTTGEQNDATQLAKDVRIKRSGDEVVDPETSTPEGCTCESVCGATIDDLYSNDWCYTGMSYAKYL